MKRTWFRNFAVKFKWLLCSKTNTFLPSSPLFLNRTQFNNYVRKHDGNRYVKHFTCWNQLLAMMFGQLSNRESLRDLIVAFEAHRAKQYHLGLGRKPIAKTTFASANQNRDYRIFLWWSKPKRNVWRISSSCKAMCMPSTQQPFHCVCRSSGGQSSVRRKEEWKHMCYMTSKLRFQLSSTSLQHQFTTQRQWRKFLMNQVLTMFSTVDTIHSRNFSKYISMNRSLLCEPRRIYNTNAVNGGAGCQRIYWQMLWLNSLNTIHTGSIQRNSDLSNSMMKNKVGSLPSWQMLFI